MADPEVNDDDTGDVNMLSKDRTDDGRMWGSGKALRSTKTKVAMWEAGSVYSETEIITSDEVWQKPSDNVTVATEDASETVKSGSVVSKSSEKEEGGVVEEETADSGQAKVNDTVGGEQAGGDNVGKLNTGEKAGGENVEKSNNDEQAGGDGDTNDGEQTGGDGDTNDGEQTGGDGDTNDGEQTGGDGDTNGNEQTGDGADSMQNEKAAENGAKDSQSRDIDFSQVQKSKDDSDMDSSQDQNSNDETDDQPLVRGKGSEDEEGSEGEEEGQNLAGPAIAFLCAIIFALIICVSVIAAREAGQSPVAPTTATTPTAAPTGITPTAAPKRFDTRPVAWRSQGPAISGNQENDGFGEQVSISSDGRRIVASTGMSSTNPSYARVLEWIVDPEETMDEDSVVGSWTSMGDDFMNATLIAMDGTGDRIAVGYANPRNEDATNDNGLVSIYDWNGIAWNLAANIITSFSGDGTSIALSSDGSRVAIGNPKNNQGTGLVNIYDLSGSNWIQVGFTLLGEKLGDEFGSSVTMSGDGKRIAIGAPESDDVSGLGYIKAYDWKEDVLEWKQVGTTLKGGIGQGIDDIGHRIGVSLAMSRGGSILVVGSYASDRTSGGAKVYEINEYLPILGWEPLGSEVLGDIEMISSTDSSLYGWSSVALSDDGRRVTVGDPMNYNGGGNGAGQVEVYDWTGSRWIQLVPDVEGNTANENLGTSVALSDDGETMVIGAPGAGLVRVYDFEQVSMMPSLVPSASPTKKPTNAPTPSEPVPQVLTQQGNPVVGGQRGDRLGERLSMSSNGLRLVASTGGYDSPYTRVLEWNEEQDAWLGSGSEFQDSTLGMLDEDGGRVAVGYGYNGVDVFEWNGSVWTRLGSLLATFSSWTGLALSNDGNRVAIGDPRYNVDVGQVNVFEWDGAFWNQVGTTLSGDEVGDLFGGSLAMSGDGRRIVIGAPESDGLYVGAGSVKVFEWDIEAFIWVQIGNTLLGDEPIEFFGRDVDISNDGSTIVVGAYESGVERVGGAKVYSWNTETANWDLMGSELLGDQLNDFFGWCVSISATGTRVAVGSPMNDSNGEDAGIVQVFDWIEDESNWQRLTDVSIAGEQVEDHMGAAVALSDDGTTITVGAPGRDCSVGLDCGEVRVYKLSAGVFSPAPAATTPPPVTPTALPTSLLWSPLGGDILGGAANDALGAVGSISSNGRRVAASASNPLNPYTVILEWTGDEWTVLGIFEGSTQIAMDKDGERIAVRYEGNVEIFDWDRDEWESIGGLITSFSNDGGSLELSPDGKQVIIGDPDYGQLQGRVYVSRKEGSSWTQIGNTLYGNENGDEFGSALAISEDGDRIVIGAPRSDMGAVSGGVVVTFELVSNEWVQIGQVLRGEDLLEYFGGSVAMSHDGNTIAIGAQGGAANRGAVMVYTWNNGNDRWQLLGNEINGDNVNDDFGWSVDLSADGRRVIMGSPSSEKDGSAPGTGLARVYDWNGSEWEQKGSDIVGSGGYERLGESVSISGDGKEILVGGSGADCINGQFYCGVVKVYEFV